MENATVKNAVQDFFEETDVEAAYLKAGLVGFGGSGKSLTATMLAVAIAKLRGVDAISFVDTETGSDYVKPYVKSQGLRLLTKKTRSFTDLVTAVNTAEALGIPLITDSITHFWIEIQRAYKVKKKITGKMAWYHYGPIKDEWGQFTDRYLNSAADIIICGRAGWEYDQDEDEEGNKELLKTGIKMKAETEMGYEPSLLLLIERLDRAGVLRDPKARGWIHRCVVLKDRFNLINGQVSDFERRESDGVYLVNGTAAPTDSYNHVFHALRPHFDSLNIGGVHRGFDASRTSEDRFEGNDRSWHVRKEQHEIECEKVTAALQLAGIGSQSTQDKQRMRELLQKCFGTPSWKEIETRRTLEEVQSGLRALRIELGLDPKPTEPLTEEESAAFEELIEKATAAGIVSKDTPAVAFKALLEQDWKEVRLLREVILEKMAAEATKAAAEAANGNSAEPGATEGTEATGPAAAQPNGEVKPKRSKKSKDESAPQLSVVQ